MSTDITRYTRSETGMVPDQSTGEWVRYEDYMALKDVANQFAERLSASLSAEASHCKLGKPDDGKQFGPYFLTNGELSGTILGASDHVKAFPDFDPDRWNRRLEREIARFIVLSREDTRIWQEKYRELSDCKSQNKILRGKMLLYKSKYMADLGRKEFLSGNIDESFTLGHAASVLAKRAARMWNGAIASEQEQCSRKTVDIQENIPAKLPDTYSIVYNGVEYVFKSYWTDEVTGEKYPSMETVKKYISDSRKRNADVSVRLRYWSINKPGMQYMPHDPDSITLSHE